MSHPNQDSRSLKPLAEFFAIVGIVLSIVVAIWGPV